jgi:hypothetical protein
MMRRQVVPLQGGRHLARPGRFARFRRPVTDGRHPTRRDQLAEVAVACLRFRQQREVVAAGERHFGADDGVQPHPLRRLAQADDAGQRIVVGQRQAVQPQSNSLRRQVFGRRRTVEQGKVAMTVQFGILRHGRRSIVELGQEPLFGKQVLVEHAEQPAGRGDGHIVAPDAPRLAPPLRIHLPALLNLRQQVGALPPDKVQRAVVRIVCTWIDSPSGQSRDMAMPP